MIAPRNKQGGYIGIGMRRAAGGRQFVIPTKNLAARFDANQGISSAGGFASQWSDISGNARNLLQATGANQPIHLPYAEEKYFRSFGTNGNYASSVIAAVNAITGDIDVDFDMESLDWASGQNDQIIGNYDTGGGLYGWRILKVAANNLRFDFRNATTATTVSIAGPSTAANSGTTRYRYRFKRIGATYTWYRSDDNGATWTVVVGPTAGTAGALVVATGAGTYIGNDTFGTSFPMGMSMYGARIYSGDRDAGGTLVGHFHPPSWASGSTFVSPTGETYTITSTGSKPAQIVDRPSLLFDGAAHWMRAAFALNQPETMFLVFKPITFTSGDRIFDGGGGVNTGRLSQNTATPQLDIYAGATGTLFNGPALGSAGVVGAVFNGASSSGQLNGGSVTAGDVGSSNMGGITLGADGTASPATFSNIQVYELIAYNVARAAATRANIIRALMAKHGVA